MNSVIGKYNNWQYTVSVMLLYIRIKYQIKNLFYMSKFVMMPN